MGFSLTPALWGLFLLALPLAIHLLNRKRGKIVRVGSIRALAQTESTRARSLHLEEPGLLLLRCFLLALVVLLLARPFLWHQPSGSSGNQWLLVSPALANSQNPDLLQKIQELKKEDGQVRLLAPGFPLLEPGDFPAGHGIDHWSLAREAARLNAPGNLIIFSESRVASLNGPRPDLDLSWIRFPLDQANGLIQTAWQDSEGQFRVRLGYSDISRTIFEELGVPLEGNDRIRVEPQVQGDRKGFRLTLNQADPFPEDDQLWVPAYSAPEIFLVWDPQSRAEDVLYLGQALEAAIHRQGVGVLTRLELGKSLPDTRASLIFWLASVPPDSRLDEMVRAGSTLVLDAGDQPYTGLGGRISMPGYARENGPVIFRRIQPASDFVPLWFDAFGQAVLEEKAIGRGRMLRLDSRLHPQWSNLVFHPAFPQWVQGLIDESNPGRVDGATLVSDRRVSGASQAAPGKNNPEIQVALSQNRPLNLFFWLMAAFAFVAERWLSERRGR